MRILPMILGGRARRIDTIEGSDSLHDFDVVDDTSWIAVEVRAAVDPVAAKFEAALKSRAIHEHVPGLTSTWEVRLYESVVLGGLIQEVAPLLVALEQLDVTGFGSAARFDEGPTVFHKSGRQVASVPHVERLVSMGVDTAWSSPDPNPKVEFLRRSTHASGGSEGRVTEEVNEAARVKRRVLSKPDALQRDERHLFVWFDSDLGGMKDFSLWSGTPHLAPSPTLPDPIDQCWAAAWSSTPGEGVGHVVVWQAIQGGRWRYPTAAIANADESPSWQ